jgi:hypothetical protein
MPSGGPWCDGLGAIMELPRPLLAQWEWYSGTPG